ncbi:MAG: divalent-cation tolerance protein CutA [Chthoniobacterales bacterium]
MDDVLLVISTFPDAEMARRVAREIVSDKLAACANVTSPVMSIYRWKERIEEAAETIVMFKTTTARLPELQNTLRERHPYDVPEIVALSITDGLPEYLRWLSDSCARELI